MDKITDRIHHWLTRHSFVRTALIFILVLLCAFELDSILRGLRSTYLADGMPIQYQHGQIVRQPDPAVPSDIQPWMTFQYINFIFKLPSSYLEQDLKISDAHYPNVQIARYARMNDLSVTAFLAQVQQAVSGYGTPSF